MSMAKGPEPRPKPVAPMQPALARDRRLKILSLSSNYPTPANPHRGTFIRSRLLALAELAHVRLLSPIALIDYGNRYRRFSFGLVKYLRDQSLEVRHLRWVYPPFGGVLNAGFLFIRLVLAVRRSGDFQFDLIDSHFGYPDGIAASWLSRWVKRPYTITLRGNETLHAKQFFRGMALRYAVRNADGIVTVSSRLRDFALSCGARPQRVRVIPNGIDPSVFHPGEETDVRKRMGIPSGVPLILSVGYLIERKGHHRVMRSLRALLDGGVDAYLAIVGAPGAEGSFEPQLAKLAGELGLEKNLYFVGALPQPVLAELMSDAQVLCLASTREGWPNVVNEALACGTPVVATDIGAVRDLIPSDDYGQVVAVDDQQALNRALYMVLNQGHDRRRIAEWGMSRSWSQVAIDVCEFFSEVLKRKTGEA